MVNKKMPDTEWIEIGRVIGDRGPKGDTGDTGEMGPQGYSTIIKGSYASYADLIAAHPTGTTGDAYLVDGELYVFQ